MNDKRTTAELCARCGRVPAEGEDHNFPALDKTDRRRFCLTAALAGIPAMDWYARARELEAEVERLTKERDEGLAWAAREGAACDAATRENAALRAEVERLREEGRRLRAGECGPGVHLQSQQLAADRAVSNLYDELTALRAAHATVSAELVGLREAAARASACWDAETVAPGASVACGECDGCALMRAVSGANKGDSPATLRDAVRDIIAERDALTVKLGKISEEIGAVDSQSYAHTEDHHSACSQAIDAIRVLLASPLPSSLTGIREMLEEAAADGWHLGADGGSRDGCEAIADRILRERAKS